MQNILKKTKVHPLWMDSNGMLHTPKGGVFYRKTTEAVAHFRQHLKYDRNWHRRRQMYIVFIMLLILSTIVLVIILIIPRPLSITDLQLVNNGSVVLFDFTSDQPLSLSISTLFAIKIENNNLVPATVQSWNMKYYISCMFNEREQSECACTDSDTLGCYVGIIEGNDGEFQLHKKEDVQYFINAENSFMFDKESNVYQEWNDSCSPNINITVGADYRLNIELEILLSFALKAEKKISDGKISLGVDCYGYASMISNGL